MGLEIDLKNHSAYHGGSWQPRRHTHAEECEKGQTFWATCGSDSEWSQLQEVMLLDLPELPRQLQDPEKAQHLKPVDGKLLRRELTHLATAFRQVGVKVTRLKADLFPHSPPNLMFLRDHFFLTPWGAILGRMASEVRAGEEKWAQAGLALRGIPILHTVRGEGTFEGSDALWLTPKTLLVGVGNRTNPAGFRQIRKVLAEFQVECHSVPLPRSVQHLLGLLQIVGPRQALVRSWIAAPQLMARLVQEDFTILEVPETVEITHRQGLNLVVLGARRVLMAANCPEFKSDLIKAKIKVMGEIAVSQLINAAGGIACATAILARGRRLHRSKVAIDERNSAC